MADFGELFYKKFLEDIGDNVSTSVEFVLEICFVEWQCGHIYLKKMVGFLTDGLVSGVLMLLGDVSERPIWYWLLVLMLRTTVFDVKWLMLLADEDIPSLPLNFQHGCHKAMLDVMKNLMMVCLLEDADYQLMFHQKI